METTLDKETHVWFGFYKGTRWDAMSGDVLKWYYDNLNGPVKERAEKELRRRYHGKLDWHSDSK